MSGLASMFTSPKGNFNWQNFSTSGGTVDDYGNLLSAKGDVVGSMKWSDKTGSWDVNNVQASDSGSEMLGLAGLGLKGMGLFTDIGQLGVAKDTLAFNKMNANRNYEAEKTKYNNAYDRTDAVNKVYGSPTVGTKI